MYHCGKCLLAFGARTGGGWVPAPLFGSSLTPVSDLVSRVSVFSPVKWADSMRLTGGL